MEGNIKEVLAKGSAAFLIRVLGAGLTFLVYLYLGRLLGTDGFGLFTLAYTLVSIFAILSRLGLDMLVMRSISSHDDPKLSGHARSELSTALMASALALLASISILFFSRHFVSTTLFDKPDLSPVLASMLPMLLFLVVAYLIGEALKGLRYTGPAMAIQYSAHPLTYLILMVIVSNYMETTPQLAALLFSLSSIPIVLYAYSYWVKITHRVSGIPAKSVRTFIKQGYPMLLMTAGSLLLSWTDVIVLGIFESKSNVGIYSAASRVALLTSLILVSVNAIVAPKFSQLYAQGKHNDLKLLARRVARLTTLIVLIPVAVLVIAPEEILGLFGEEFRVGASILIVLALGQFINVACGSVGYLLMMSNHEKTMQRIMLMSAILNIFLSVLFVQQFGVIGVAYATAVSVAIWNILALVEVKAKLGFWMLGYFRG